MRLTTVGVVVPGRGMRASERRLVEAPARTRGMAGAIAMLVTLGLLGLAGPAGAGQSWTVVPSANNGSRFNFLYDVSCISSNTCTAVGVSTNASGSADVTLIEARTGGSWHILASPSPGATWNFLYGVSCVSTKFCVAVGRYETFNGANRNLIESWDGRVWSVVPAVNRGGSGNVLDAVSCTSPVACTAVGSWQSTITAATQTLVEAWDGKVWTVVPSPNPAGSTVSGLASVSCASPEFCAAVGTSSNGAGGQQTLTETWNGKSWSLGSRPGAGTRDNVLADIACTGTGECVAVGNSTTSPAGAGRHAVVGSLVETLRGRTWKIVPAPNPGTALTVLASVSCGAGANRCAAVGAYQRAGSDRRFTLVESWNGKTWKVSASPDPAAGTAPDDYIGGITGAGLNGVSCVSATSCHAVGFRDDVTGHDQSLIERFG